MKQSPETDSVALSHYRAAQSHSQPLPSVLFVIPGLAERKDLCLPIMYIPASYFTWKLDAKSSIFFNLETIPESSIFCEES